MSQQYSLRWNNHQPNFISMFTTLLNTQTLVDVTLAAEGRQLLAHKVVLSACSTYFQALFIDNPSRHPIVILKDVTFADLRTMVDFMYYGEVNVTEEQLPQVLITAKLLKIKGLTEMPEPASMTRSHTSTDFTSTGGDSMESQRHSTSPGASPSPRRKRKSSTGSTHLNMVTEAENREEVGQSVELVRDAASITLSSVPQQRRRDYLDERLDNTQQTAESHNLNIVEPLAMDANPAGMPQGGQWSMVEHTYPRYSNACIGSGALQPDPGMYMNNVPHMNPEMNDYGQAIGVTGPSPGPSCVTDNTESSSSQSLKHRRSKFFKRQSRVPPEDREPRKQSSDPGPATTSPQLQKHGSYPQYTSPKNRRSRTQDQEVGSLLIRAVTVINRQSSTSTSASASASTSTDTQPDAAHTQRASHTPAVRSGPPLSCNFCWNTVDECGRILRRKTQYHCPECRTNLCIVPCFHEYHDGPESEASTTASAR